MSWCRCTAALGVPVVPDVYSQKATSSLVVSAGSSSSDSAVTSSANPTCPGPGRPATTRSEEHTSELQSQSNLVCRLLLEKKKKKHDKRLHITHRHTRSLH